jgi:hypothetical protein
LSASLRQEISQPHAEIDRDRLLNGLDAGRAPQRLR